MGEWDLFRKVARCAIVDNISIPPEQKGSSRFGFLKCVSTDAANSILQAFNKGCFKEDGSNGLQFSDYKKKDRPITNNRARKDDANKLVGKDKDGKEDSSGHSRLNNFANDTLLHRKQIPLVYSNLFFKHNDLGIGKVKIAVPRYHWPFVFYALPLSEEIIQTKTMLQEQGELNRQMKEHALLSRQLKEIKGLASSELCLNSCGRRSMTEPAQMMLNDDILNADALMIDQDIVNLIGLPGELYKNIDGKNFHDSHQNCLLVDDLVIFEATIDNLHDYWRGRVLEVNDKTADVLALDKAIIVSVQFSYIFSFDLKFGFTRFKIIPCSIYGITNPRSNFTEVLLEFLKPATFSLKPVCYNGRINFVQLFINNDHETNLDVGTELSSKGVCDYEPQGKRKVYSRDELFAINRSFCQQKINSM
ncbi:unnamed protein product [Dracunculus medinensis]|uniref:RRM domain-containing protein n=1 Tax=Dracunculus medinensis TaxID=318479 RepID=A0A0N4U4P0_DRAME|nr:unnamed protein product [Dracunculus medinensis]